MEGAFTADGRGGIGGLIWEWLQISDPCWQSLEAELSGVDYDLNYAYDNGIRKLRLETNSNVHGENNYSYFSCLKRHIYE